MRRLIILAVLLPLLASCALIAPEVDERQLDAEYQTILAEIETAAELGAEDYRPADLAALREEAEEVRQVQQTAPSRDHLEQYKNITNRVRGVSLATLQNQLSEKALTVQQLEDEVEDYQAEKLLLVERIAELEEELEQARQEIEQVYADHADFLAEQQQFEEQKEAHLAEKQEFEEQRDELISAKQQLQDQLQSLQTENQILTTEKDQLIDRMELQEELISELDSSVDYVEQRADSLQLEMQQKTRQMEELEAENRAIIEDFERKLAGLEPIDDETVERVYVRDESLGVVVNLGAQILFEIGDARLLPDGRQTLASIAEVLNQYPDRELLVEGHTCDLPIREAYPSNWELSAHRALEVLKYLAYAQDVERDRIAAVAYGQFRPLKPNTSDANRRLNRRVEITLLPAELETKTKQLND